jgi:hypothetical protein
MTASLPKTTEIALAALRLGAHPPPGTSQLTLARLDRIDNR